MESPFRMVLVAGALGIPALAIASGCSAVGAAVGSRIQSESAVQIDTSDWQHLLDVPRGTRLEVRLATGAEVRADLEGVCTRDGRRFEEMWRTAEGASVRHLPAPGDWITVGRRSRLSGGTAAFTFLGLGTRDLVVRQSRKQLPRRVPLDELEYIEAGGERVDAGEIAALLSEGTLRPIETLCLHRDGSALAPIPIAGVVSVRYPRRHSNTGRGFLAGLLVDVVLLGLWINAWSDWSPT